MIEEIVLIDAGFTVLQAKLVLPQNPQFCVVVLHKPAGSRHDKSVKRVERSLDDSVASLVADLTDESEGSLAIGDDEFLLSRTNSVVEWFLQKSECKKVSLYLLEYSKNFVDIALSDPRINEIYLEKEAVLWHYTQDGEPKKVEKPPFFHKN